MAQLNKLSKLDLEQEEYSPPLNPRQGLGA
jgi:hypothetical protein